LFLPELLAALRPYSINIPSLRDRQKDIVDLAWAELVRLNRRFGVAKFLDPLALEILYTQYYPGNVRELKNVIYQAVIFSSTPEIGPFLRLLFNSRNLNGAHKRDPQLPEIEIIPPLDPPQITLDLKGNNLATTLKNFEKSLLTEASNKCRNTREMAQLLGVSQASVSRKLKKYKVNSPGTTPKKD
jgi:TyrR family helix-turn-helix protein